MIDEDEDEGQAPFKMQFNKPTTDLNDPIVR